MKTWAVHIGGLVQGVGFRPFVSQLAESMHINGCVSNTHHGLYIQLNADEETAAGFYNYLIHHPPSNAIIDTHFLKEIPHQEFSTFSIHESVNYGKPDLLLTPDIAICPQCKQELTDPSNKRFHYPFITCLNCGPRYSIVTSLPYDRPHTTMNNLEMCAPCKQEYSDTHDRRHFSQTNSCHECFIPMHLYNACHERISNQIEDILCIINKSLNTGDVVAIKGIGGYLLLCDATNALAIKTLRDRKKRPAKPFALLYPDCEAAEKDVILASVEKSALQSKAAPIVLCNIKNTENLSICNDLIAPGLNKIGIMLPYTGLMALITQTFKKPLVATSGNISGAPIMYQDDAALLRLSHFADWILIFDRDIVVPQDDSVLQFSAIHQQKIMIRRSRGFAPNYFPNPFRSTECLLATGGELKSAFALLDHKKLYVSQFLGDQENYDAQLIYEHTLQHLLKILQATPLHILVDKHPGYAVSSYGRNLADKLNIPCTEIQHHKAHFAAVLAENNLLQTNEPVLGVIWDGAGYGDDGQTWGSEFFLYEDQQVERVAHLDYYPYLLGDKMSREPSLSAISLCREDLNRIPNVKARYTEAEWSFLRKMIQQPQHQLTSSMGRLLDGIASILGIQYCNTYEGEAAMKLEALALASMDQTFDDYSIPLLQSRLNWRIMIEELLQDKKRGVPSTRIAFKVFVSLARCVRQVANYFKIKKISFSGGVFQNALLTDLMISMMQDEYTLYFHRQLSANDECIGFGQIANYFIEHSIEARSVNNFMNQPT